MVRITAILILSFVWATCVLESRTLTGGRLPVSECQLSYECFAVEISYNLFFFSQTDVKLSCEDVLQAPSKLEGKLTPLSVVNCLHFVDPNGLTWMQFAAIAYSLALLNIRAFELVTWICLRSPVYANVVALLLIIYSVVVIALYVSGILASFVATWVSFVMLFDFPCILGHGIAAASHLRSLKKQQLAQFQAITLRFVYMHIDIRSCFI